MFLLPVFRGEGYTRLQGQVQMFASKELGSVWHGEQSCGGHIFCTDPAFAWLQDICLAGYSPARQTGASCMVHASLVFPESILHSCEHRIYFIVLIIFNKVIHQHLKTFLLG